MAYAEQGSRSKLPTIAAVALVHAGIGYAFISGLAYNVIHETFPVFQVASIADTPPPPEDVAPPPPKRREILPERVIVPERIVTLPDVDVVTLQPLRDITPPVLPRTLPAVEPVVPAPPRSALASGVRPSGSKAAWITSDDYPPAALRNGEEGVVAIGVGIDARGRVTGCRVTGSSGSSALDDATCRLYAQRARFAPAKDDAGIPVVASFADRIVWRIPK